MKFKVQIFTDKWNGNRVTRVDIMMKKCITV